MFKKFKTSELVFLALIGAIVFVFDILFVSVLEAAIGIPGAGVLIDTIFVVGIATIGGLVVKKFGVYTLLSVVYSALAIPTNIIGPPGAYKVLIGFILGLLADIIILAFRYKKIGYYLSLPIANTLVIPVMLFALITLALPGADELLKAIWFFIPLTLIESLVGAWLGVKLYDKKIKKMKIIKQIAS